jgi:hypothetical protein
MTIDQILKTHETTIDLIRKKFGYAPTSVNFNAEAIRNWCYQVGVLDAELVSLDEALSRAGKLLAKPVDVLPPMPWRNSRFMVTDTDVYDDNGNNVAIPCSKFQDNRVLKAIRDYIIDALKATKG